MNIDTTATILQVSPASATRAEVAGPQTGASLGAGFAQLLAALLSSATPAPAADSQPAVATVGLPDAKSIPKPAEPTTSFDGIYAIFGVQPAVPALPQPLIPTQTQPSEGSPQAAEPLPAKLEVTGAPTLPAPVASGNSPAEAVAVTPLAAKTMSMNSFAQLQLAPNSPSVSAPQICPVVVDGSRGESSGSVSPVLRPVALSDRTATPSPTGGAVTPTADAESAVQVEQPQLEISAATAALSPRVDAVPARSQIEGAQSSSPQPLIAGTASPVEKLDAGQSDAPSTWASAFAPSTVGSALAKATSWGLGQLRPAHSEAAPGRDLLASIARKFGNSTGSVFQGLIQRVGQFGSSTASEADLSQQSADGKSVGDAVSDAVPLNGTDHADDSVMLQTLADASAHVSQNGQATESQPHHGHTTLAQLPQRLAEIVTSRIEQPHSADQTSVVLRLDPPELGRVTVHVSMANDVVSIRLVASDDGSRQTLETHLNDLQQSLSDQGISLNHCQVECKAGGGDWSDRNRQWPIPGEADLFPTASRPAPAPAIPEAQSTSRTRLDYVA